jgi:trimeric autotransporter adhesin
MRIDNLSGLMAEVLGKSKNESFVSALRAYLAGSVITKPKSIVSVETYGLLPSEQDQSMLFQQALNSAFQDGYTHVYMPSGKYCYTSNITTKVGILGDGDDTELVNISVNGTNSRISMQNVNGAMFMDFKISAPNSGTAQINNEANAGILLTGCNDFVVSRVTPSKIGNAAILTRRCKRGKIFDNDITDIWHDAIHMTNGCENIIVAFNRIVNGGDDAIAIVDYLSQKRQSRNIQVVANQIDGVKFARGITVIGGSRVTIVGNSIKKTYVAGIMVASESSYKTFGPKNVVIDANIIDGCGNVSGIGLDGSVSATGAISVSAWAPAGMNKRADVENVTICNNLVLNSANVAIASPNAGGTVRGLNILSNQIIDGADTYNKNGLTKKTSAAVSSGSTVIPVKDAYMVAYGMTVVANGVPAEAKVIAATKNSVTLSLPTTAAIANDSNIRFFGIGWEEDMWSTSANAASGSTVLTIDETTNAFAIGTSLQGSAVNTQVAEFTATSITLHAATSAAIVPADIMSMRSPSTVLVDNIAFSGSAASGATVLPVANTGPIYPGMGVHGTGFNRGTKVTEVTDTTVTVDTGLNTARSSGNLFRCIGSITGDYAAINLTKVEDVKIKDNVIDNCGSRGIYLTTANSGLIEVLGNIGRNINSSNHAAGRFIDVEDNSVNATYKIDDNYMKQPDIWPRAMDALIRNTNRSNTIWGENNRCQNDIVGLSLGSSLAPEALTVGASPWTYTNNTNNGVRLFISGGTVSSVEFGAQGVNSQNTGVTSGMIDLKYKERVVITYTAAPTVSQVIRVGR